MKVVWPAGQATVRDVYDALRQRREVAYTTVQTMNERLSDVVAQPRFQTLLLGLFGL
ncbi:MAG: BlaI/MecI/CopY family transcriptional regulator, partial [Gemmatimonadetes bacterium]|nr:BlaI/MecI/CopY family transcriptional regulator [Gemmatimonadota bacterium]